MSVLSELPQFLRHVPDTIEAVPAVPRTMAGKKVETPVEQILQGRAVADVVSPGVVDRPDALAAFLPTGATR